MFENQLEGVLKSTMGQIVNAGRGTSVLCEEVSTCGGEITMWVALYRGVKSAQAQVVGLLGKQAIKVAQGIVGGIVTGGIPGTALQGIPEAANNVMSIYGGADSVAGVYQNGVDVDQRFIDNMQVAGAKQSGNRLSLYYSLRVTGKILMEALVRIRETPDGKLQVVVLPALSRDDAMASTVLGDAMSMASASRIFEVDSGGRATEVSKSDDSGASDDSSSDNWSTRAAA